MSWNWISKGSWPSWLQKYLVVQFWAKNVEVYAATNLWHLHCAMLMLGYCINFHNFGWKLTNGIFLYSEGPGGFEYSFSAHLDTFEILTLLRSYADLWGCCALSLAGRLGWKLTFNLWVVPHSYGVRRPLIFRKYFFLNHPNKDTYSQTPICGRTPYCGTNACWPNFLLYKFSPKTPFCGTQNPDLRDFFLQIQKNSSIFSSKFAFYMGKYEVASIFWAWWGKVNSYFSQTPIKDWIKR